MTDTTKPDLSREAVERLAQATYFITPEAGAKETAATLRALLTAKEAAERERAELMQMNHDLRRERDVLQADLTEARAANAAAWEAGFSAGIRWITDGMEDDAPAPAPSATEALRRVKAEVFAEAITKAGQTFGAHTTLIAAIPNPYHQPEKRHE